MPRRRKDIVRLLEQTAAQRPPVLDLSNCALGDLLDEVCRMDWLVELDLSHCHVNTLPETIGNFAALTRLVLAENQLTALPDAMTRLTSLQHLDLRAAGFEPSVSEAVKAWLQTVPAVIWIDGKPPNFAPDPPLVVSEHPNDVLAWLKSALQLYTDALAMEDRGFGGSGKRSEADRFIERVFRIPGLPGLLPEFYRDCQAHRFYSTSCESEKSLDRNPFRLPTQADDEWVASHPVIDDPSLGLEAFVEHGRHVLTVHRRTGVKTEVVVCTHGWVNPNGAPDGPAERRFADCAARLYQAGGERFYVRLETDGSGVPGERWFGSGDGGASWQEQAGLTHAWLDKNRSRWREVDRLDFRLSS